MAKTESIWCRECDHEHVCAVEYDDWGDEHFDIPEGCENCGAPLDGGGVPDGALRSAERRQMGIGS